MSFTQWFYWSLFFIGWIQAVLWLFNHNLTHLYLSLFCFCLAAVIQLPCKLESKLSTMKLYPSELLRQYSHMLSRMYFSELELMKISSNNNIKDFSEKEMNLAFINAMQKLVEVLKAKTGE